MAIELKIPAVGESITEAVIGQWLKQVGDAVAQDEPLVVIETDKVTVELPSPQAGTLSQILKQSGEDAKIGEVIGYLEAGAGGAKAAPKKGATAKEPAATKEPAAAKEPPAPKEPAKAAVGEARVMPAAKRLLAESGLEASELAATGPGGRLLKEDVLRHLDDKSKPETAAAVQAPAPPPTAAEPASGLGVYREEEVVKMTPLRRRVAARLVEAQQTAALLTTFNEIDMSMVMALRKQYQDRFVAAHGVKLGFMSFFVKAVVEALKEVPQVNAEIRGQDIVYRNYFDIGIAVGGGKGLVVPILRNAERLSFAEIEKAIGELGRRAKENQLKLEELQGGTFTISNGGIYGSLLSTPIVNPPQSGILGMHAIQDRPVARDGQVVIRPMMYVALTYDHRMVDGREAVTFLVKVKERVEDPTRILLET